MYIIKENGFKVATGSTPAQAETLHQGLERAAACICLHVNADKTEYTCFDQRFDISTLNGSSLKLADMFTYLGKGMNPIILPPAMGK